MANELRDELLNDPLVRGYAGMTDQEAADDLNTEYRPRDRSSMTSTEVWQAIDVTELRALADGDRSLVMAVLQFESINPFGNEAALFTALFGGGSTTLTALATARVETISRAVELALRLVRAGDVRNARV
tara:strand:+ start:744 stop:1133 length:390 start_codon:yes stop_codon:yes gene_type:complete